METSPRLTTGPWTIADLNAGKVGLPKNGRTVFSCFHCGGGSSFGYKLAGYDVLGGVEIDKEMMELYRKNHKPKYSYLMGIQDFNKIPDSELPAELFDLDILDGSPPCSSFSMAGARERKWNNKTKFREGQAVQVLDDLFFHFIETASKLRPKVIVAENVKGLIQGNARGYVKEIFREFEKAGYSCQLFLLNASRMGVPQRRERTFFVAKAIDAPKLRLEFTEEEISFTKAVEGLPPQYGKPLPAEQAKLWRLTRNGNALSSVHPKGHWFNQRKVDPNAPAATVIANPGAYMYHHFECRNLSGLEISRLQTFPDDYDFQSMVVKYVCGMSVPPFMMQRVADQIERQWLGKVIHDLSR